jgi:hypothetical protein
MSRAQEIADLLSGVTITTADNTSQLILKSTDADASAGPRLDLKRDSGSPADNDTVGRFRFLFDNDAAEETEAVRIDAFIPDVSDGTEDATFQTLTMVGGTMRSRVEHSSTETVFNQDSQNLDFRVEGNGDANLLFVDAGNDRIGIGTNSPSQLLSIHAESGSARMELISSTSGTSIIDMGDTGDADIGGVRYDNSNNSLSFRTNNDVRLSIDSSGDATFTNSDAGTIIARVGTNVAGIKTSSGDDFCVGTADFSQAIRIKNNTGHVGVGSTAPSGHFHVSSADTEIVNFIEATKSDYTGEILYIQTTRQANTTHRYIKCNENNGNTTSFQVLGNGNTQNINNSFTATSDERIKQDITDATSQWDDIKALQVKNFKLKCKVSVDGDDAPKHIGVVAQDLEAAGMNGLVENIEPDPYQKDTLGIEEDVKSVKYSILYMKAVKALQEAMTRIETLETQRADLEARLSALEAG